MKTHQYEKILKVTKQQARIAAFSLSQFNENRNKIRQRQQELQVSLEITQAEFLRQFETSSPTESPVEKRSLNIQQLQVTHRECEWLKIQDRKLLELFQKNEFERLKSLQAYEALYSRQLALEKLVERLNQSTQVELQRHEQIELTELTGRNSQDMNF